MAATLKAFGAHFRFLRRNCKLTQEQVAERAGINSTYYGRVERGEANISLELLIAIAKVFQVTPAELLDIDPVKDLEELRQELHHSIDTADEKELKILEIFCRSLFR